VERVEDVVSLGDDIIVRVDDVDPQGKVALSPVGEDGEVAPSNGDDRPPRAERERSDRGDRGDRGDRPERAPREERPAVDSSGREFVSFEEAFEGEAKTKFGDLGPAEVTTGGGGGAGDGGGPRRNRDRDRRPGRSGGGGGGGRR
jgi:polyribonucleotide nucleotidyltransferase